MSEVLGQRYVLGEPLGQGGAARVFRAYDRKLGVERALKLLEVPAGNRRQQMRRRLRSEARTMARLGHPHVLQIHDVGQDEERDWIVMELATGSTWERLKKGPAIELGTALRWTIEVLQALEAAHEAGIVHRDVKPHNILLDKHDRALLADFGIALVTQDEGRTTRTGVAMGSLAFMAPEQRLDARRVGPSADIYSVGATLYQLVTGANPVDLFTVGVEHERMKLLPEALRPVVSRATRLDAGSRYLDAASMRRALEAIELGEAPPVLPAPTVEHPPTVPTPQARSTILPPTERLDPPEEPTPQSPRLALAGLLGLLLAIGGLGWWLSQPGPAQEIAPPVSGTPMVESPNPEGLQAQRVEFEPKTGPVAFGPAPQGRWQLLVGGFVYEVSLRGEDERLRGRLDGLDTRTEERESYNVLGTYQRGTGELLLTPDVPYGLSISATMNDDLTRFEGTCRLPASEGPCVGRLQ